VHRLFFAGLRRRNAFAGVLLASLILGSVWYSQTRVLREPARERVETRDQAPVDIARLDGVIAPDRVPLPSALPRIVKRTTSSPEILIETLPEPPAEPASAEAAPPQVQASQIASMKFVTDDPNIIVYWLPTDKGD